MLPYLSLHETIQKRSDRGLGLPLPEVYVLFTHPERVVVIRLVDLEETAAHPVVVDSAATEGVGCNYIASKK